MVSFVHARVSARTVHRRSGLGIPWPAAGVFLCRSRPRAPSASTPALSHPPAAGAPSHLARPCCTRAAASAASAPAAPDPLVNLAALLAPRSVAVVGASPRPESAGHRLLANIANGGFAGRLYAVHPIASEVAGVPCFPSLRAVPEPPGGLDLVVVAVPAAAVPGVARDAAAVGARGLVVISAGFRETGDAVGAALDAALVAAARAGRLRVVGPNGVGVVNGHPGVRLHAVFCEPLPVSDAVPAAALMAQSGAVGISALHECAWEAGVLGTLRPRHQLR